MTDNWFLMLIPATTQTSLASQSPSCVRVQRKTASSWPATACVNENCEKGSDAFLVGTKVFPSLRKILGLSRETGQRLKLIHGWAKYFRGEKQKQRQVGTRNKNINPSKGNTYLMLQKKCDGDSLSGIQYLFKAQLLGTGIW